ncbi:helix-turn-helix domain-containing protein [Streptomyces sp. NPDC056632]|uniref:helix-turn-helix domain-containing protein n=1 Tax=Streptomyces sp. NPDC056632 TaxID=3345884 RepID=UPI00367827FE
MRRAVTAHPFDWPAPRKRVDAATRTRVGAELRKRYDAGASIRDLMRQSGRSYNFVHTLLLETGVTFRQRGGWTHA